MRGGTGERCWAGRGQNIEPGEPASTEEQVNEGMELGDGGRGQSGLGTSQRPRARLRNWGAVMEAVGHPEGFDAQEEGD